MVTFFIFVLTSLLIVVCGVSVLLILMQRPSEESGIGVTLGGGVATSVFGGEAVNVLAKWTKHAVVSFFVLSFILSLLHMSKEEGCKPKYLLEKKAMPVNIDINNNDQNQAEPVDENNTEN